MLKEMYIVVKEPGEPPIGRMIMNDVDAFQRIVGGDFEEIKARLPEGLALFANQDAKRLELKQNLFIGPNLFDLVLGTCYIKTSRDGVDMTPDQMVAAGKWFSEVSI